jgi:hypothetical protein
MHPPRTYADGRGDAHKPGPLRSHSGHHRRESFILEIEPQRIHWSGREIGLRSIGKNWNSLRKKPGKREGEGRRQKRGS